MNKKKYYKRIFNYFKKEKKLIIVYIITSLLIIVFNTITPVLSAKGLAAITNADINNIFKYSLLIFIISIIDRLVGYFSSLSSSKIQDNVEIKIKGDISSELFDLEMKNFDKEGTGFFSSRISREPGNLAGIFMRLRYNLTSLFTSFGVMVYIFYVNYIFGIYFLIASVVFFIMYMKRTKRWELERIKYNEFDEKYTSSFSELIRGIKDIKVLNLKDVLIKKTMNEQKEIVDFNYKMRKNEEIFSIFNSIINNLVDFIFIIVAIVLLKNGSLSGANLLIIYMYKNRTLYFVSEFSDLYRNYKDFNLSLERLYELIDGVKYPKEKFGSVHLDNIKGNIEFKNVIFKYDKNNVLNGVNFKIKGNETIGIVGKSGVGK